MTESFVELEPIPVLRVRADWRGAGPAAAFAALEAKLPTLKGRRFYGVGRLGPGEEEYFACVARIETDDPVRMELGAGEIPGGWYARRRIRDWEENVRQIPLQFKEMIRALGDNVDPSRPAVEYYRSQGELFVLEPVKAHAPT